MNTEYLLLKNAHADFEHAHSMSSEQLKKFKGAGGQTYWSMVKSIDEATGKERYVEAERPTFNKNEMFEYNEGLDACIRRSGKAHEAAAKIITAQIATLEKAVADAVADPTANTVASAGLASDVRSMLRSADTIEKRATARRFTP
jgi:hypothetical protein